MFEWAHLLHRQVYDVLADERLDPAQRDARIAELQAYYLTRKDLAFSTRPKSMALMQEQPYSLAFRQRFPKFNGLIWAYHWLQVGLYEPLLAGTSVAERQAGVAATIARFRQLIADAPNSTPYVMPMTSVISPRFAARYPEIAIIFDNLHSMHDVISDILANPAVPRDRKRAEILLAANRYRDDTTEVMTVAAWRTMSAMMGIQNMGGLSTGIVGPLPTPTVARGAVMRHDASGKLAADEHAGHDMSPSKPDTSARDEHAMHQMPEMGGMANDSLAVDSVVGAFHRALAEGDSAAALALLAPDVTIQESGEAESKEEYQKSHLSGDIEFARSVKTERSPRRVSIREHTAWVTSSSTTVGTFHGRAIDSLGEELMVLAREKMSWRIVAIHWSSHARRPR
jgi:ketosteroid isomerase-like protein